MKEAKLAKDILQLIGFEKNIKSFSHCMTRLRFNLHDEGLADNENLKKLDGVIGLTTTAGQFQIILGSNVSSVYVELVKLIKNSKDRSIDIAGNNRNKKNIISMLFDTITGVFAPIIPAISAAGILKALLSVLTLFNIVSIKSDAYTTLEILADSAFYFLPMLLAYSTANKFSCNKFVAVLLAGILLHPDFSQLRNSGIDSLRFIGLPVKLLDYSSSVLPILIIVWTMSLLEKFISKTLSESLKVVLEPVLILIVMAPLSLIFIGPLCNYAGNCFAVAFTFLYEKTAVITGTVLCGTYSLIVTTGMHYGLVPVELQSMQKYGYDYLVPIITAANVGQSGAAFAVYLMTKNKNMKSIAGPAFISALLGITEPAVYGVNMKLKRPFIGAAIGAASGGFIMSTFKVKYYVTETQYFENLTIFIAPMHIYYIIGIVLSFVISAAGTFILSFEDIS